jgi:hypothetical protein
LYESHHDASHRGRDKQLRTGPHYSRGHKYEARQETRRQKQYSSATGQEYCLTCGCAYFPETDIPVVRQDFAEGQHPSSILFDVVERGLRQRKVVYKAPLEMLRIDNCFISAQRAQALQKLVQKFHWDEYEEFDLYDDLDDIDGYDSDCDEPMAR